jgi:hypothetical protein
MHNRRWFGAWLGRPHPALEKVVGGRNSAVGVGAVRWWGRFSIFPPGGAAQRLPRAGTPPPPLKTIFCTERLRANRISRKRNNRLNFLIDLWSAA